VAVAAAGREQIRFEDAVTTSGPGPGYTPGRKIR
jgi:hypothetical protein